METKYEDTYVKKIEEIYILCNHCELTKGECQFQLTLLSQLCDSIAPLALILRTSVRKINLFGWLHIINSKHFCSFQYLFNKRSYAKNI